MCFNVAVVPVNVGALAKPAAVTLLNVTVAYVNVGTVDAVPASQESTVVIVAVVGVTLVTEPAFQALAEPTDVVVVLNVGNAPPV